MLQVLGDPEELHVFDVLVDLVAAVYVSVCIRQRMLHTSAYVSDIFGDLVAAVYVSVCIRQRMLHTSAYVFDILGDLVAAGKALLRQYLY